MRRTRGTGFTIVELMVVIAIMAILLGLLLPALAGVRDRGRKASEIHNVRQIGIAWSLYSNSNDGMALPGYMSAKVQGRWAIQPEFPDHTDIPPDTAAPYPWRLAPYIENSHQVFHDHELEQDDKSVLTMMAEADEIAYEPGFGYNAYHLGGWWDAIPGTGGAPARPYHVFQDATNADGARIQVVAKSIAQVRRSEQFIAFCSSSQPGVINAGQFRRLPDDMPGAHYVVPPYLADQQQWTRNGPDQANLTVLQNNAIPIHRYTEQVALFYVDGHTDGQAPGALEDMRMWVNKATTVDFTFIGN